jgi:hypothetical protein
MYHDLPPIARLWPFLVAVDEDLAKEVREKRCGCGGRLHSSNYLRKVQGARPKLPELQCFRLSFCCELEGCRKRVTPPSVRFLGRKVYLGVLVVLISAMRQGPTPRRVRKLSEDFKISETTIIRWQTFWREHFPQTPFWKTARARFFPRGKIVSLLYSLVDTFLGGHPQYEGWIRLLRFLSPISVPGGL